MTDADSTIAAILIGARATFGAERATFVQLQSDLSIQSRTVTADGRIVRQTEPTEQWLALVDLVPPGRHGTVLAPRRGRTEARRAAPSLPCDGMIAAVATEGRVAGYLTVTDRLGNSGRFDHDTLLVLQLMARQVAVALVGERPPSIDDLHLLEAELNHRVRHDALTGLVNDIGLRERVANEISLAGDRRLAVMIIRVALLDRPGEHLDDALLVISAQRLRHCVRDRDTVARALDDEFAVIASTPGGEHDAFALAQRILWNLATEVNVDGAERRLDVSIGICLRGRITDPDVVIDRAGNASRSAEATPRRIVVTNA